MKKIFSFAVMLLAGATLFTACESDNDSNPTMKSPTTFVLNTPIMTSTTVDLANSKTIDFNWSQPDYGFPVLTTYQMQMSTNADMSGAVEIGESTTLANTGVDAGVMASTLTDMLINSGKSPSDFPMDIPIYFRVKANVQNSVNEVMEGTEILSNIVKLDKVHLLYSLPPVTAPDHLYLIGSFNGWNWSTSLSMVQCYDGANVFWHMVYIDGSGIKFNQVQAWDGGEVGFSGIKIGGDLGDEIINGDGNIASSKPGWYLMIITCEVEGRNIVYDVQFNKPEVWLMGTVTPSASWSEKEDGCMFNVPTSADADFVSPAFTNDTSGDGGLRAYVKVPGYDWWKSEFMVFDKKIVYRGMGGDQDRIEAKAGQKLYLNFTKETGDIK